MQQSYVLLKWLSMVDKRTLTVTLFLLLLSVLFMAFRLQHRPAASFGTLPKKIDATNRVHTSFYQKALEVWPANLKAETETSSSKIHLTWDKPKKAYNNFLVTVSDPKTTWTRTEAGEHDRVGLDVPDLKPDTVYTLVVLACLDPNCKTWFVADQEAEGRTSKMIWKIRGTDITNTLTRNDEFDSTLLTWETMNMQWSSGTPLTEKEEQTLKRENVYTEKKTDGLVVKLNRTEGKTKSVLYASLINP